MLEKLKNSTFFRHVIHLMTGTILSQVINFIVAVALTRFFSAAEFGSFTLYLLISNTLAVFAAARMEMAVMLPREKEEGLAIALVGGIIATVVCLIFLVLFLIISFTGLNTLMEQWGVQRPMLLFVPLTAFLTALGQIAIYCASRDEKYKFISNLRILQALVIGIFSIIFGMMKTGWLGLAYANILGLAGGLIFFYAVRRADFTSSVLAKVNRAYIIQSLKEYRNFPLYSAPLAFVNNISLSILGYAIQLSFGAQLLGIYSYAFRIVNMPLNLIASSFTTVFYQKITSATSSMPLYLKAFAMNFLLGTVMLAPIVIAGKPLFGWLFGPAWIESAIVAKYIALYLLSSFAVGSITSVFAAKRKEGIMLVWQLIYLLLACLILSRKELTFYQSLLTFSIYSFVMYIILFFIGIYVIKRSNETPS